MNLNFGFNVNFNAIFHLAVLDRLFKYGGEQSFEGVLILTAIRTHVPIERCVFAFSLRMIL